MTRAQWIRRLVGGGVTLLAVVLALSAGAPPHGTVRIGAYVLAAIVLGSTVERLVAARDGDRGPSVFAAVARPPRPPADPPPASLEGLQRTVRLAVDSSGGWHFRLRPRLRDIAATVLEDRRRVRLDGDEPAARALLGEAAWARLRPDVPEPDDRFAPGLTEAQLSDLVRAIEEL